MIYKKHFLVLLCIFLLANCAAINPYYEEPEVSVDSFTLVPTDTLNPVFEIGLRVINPNKQGLKVQGLSYTAVVEGQKILSGVNGEAFSIAGYDEQTLTLQAKVNLFNGLQLISKLINSQNSNPQYELNIKMDVGSFKVPIIITRKGSINSLDKP